MRPLTWPLIALVPALFVSACTREPDADDSAQTTSTSDGSDTSDVTTTGESTDTGSSDTQAACTMDLCGDLCVDLSADPANCGECGVDCLGTVCEAGSCVLGELATEKGRLLMIHVDDEHLYYGGDNVFVSRMTKTGLDDGPLVNGFERCTSSVDVGDTIAWSSDNVGLGIRGCIKPDCEGGVVEFYPGDDIDAMTFNVGLNTIYWNEGGSILERVWPGGDVFTVVANQGTVTALDSDATHLYWVAELSPTDKRLRRIDLAMLEPPLEVVGSRELMGQIKVIGDKIYWSEDGIIYSRPLPPAVDSPILVAETPGRVRRITADDTYLYWTASTMSGYGYLMRCALSGCVMGEELLNPSRPWGITVDEQALYWVTETGVIGKMLK